MTQMVKSLVQCNKCNSAGHPNQMIGFLKTDKRKADGKSFWDLINEDGSAHVHKTTVVLPDIEEPQSQPQPPLTISTIHKGIVTGGNESKSVEITSPPTKTVQNSNPVNDVTLEDLKKRVEVMEKWIKKVSESAVMNL